VTVSEDGVREAIRSILAGTRYPGYFIDTIEACVQAIVERANQEAQEAQGRCIDK
jgi:hypothetical protein